MSMNRMLCRHLERSYVTAVYAVVDTETHRVTFANAGHPPPLFQRRGETIAQAEPEHGLILGLLPDTQHEQLQRRLRFPAHHGVSRFFKTNSGRPAMMRESGGRSCTTS
jgi:serine phosphatase RsbU (regulator of sigma subunit)